MPDPIKGNTTSVNNLGFIPDNYLEDIIAKDLLIQENNKLASQWATNHPNNVVQRPVNNDKIDYPSTDRRSSNYAGNPNWSFAAPNMTGKQRADAEAYHGDIIGGELLGLGVEKLASKAYDAYKEGKKLIAPLAETSKKSHRGSINYLPDDFGFTGQPLSKDLQKTSNELFEMLDTPKGRMRLKGNYGLTDKQIDNLLATEEQLSSSTLGDFSNGMISINPNLPEGLQRTTWRHELEHAAQDAQGIDYTKPVSDMYIDQLKLIQPEIPSGYVASDVIKKGKNVDTSNWQELFTDLPSAREYIKKPQEAGAFAAEVKQYMLDKGLAKSSFDKFSPEMVEQAHKMYQTDKSIPLRLFDLLDPLASENNYSKMAKAFNKMMTLTGVGGAALQSQQEKPTYADGGVRDGHPTKPYITSNLEDYNNRTALWNDSLYAYNNKNFSWGKGKTGSIEEVRQWEKEHQQDKLQELKDNNVYNDGDDIYTSPLDNIYDPGTTTSYMDYKGIRPVRGDYYFIGPDNNFETRSNVGSFSAEYKKPTQPVIFREPVMATPVMGVEEKPQWFKDKRQIDRMREYAKPESSQPKSTAKLYGNPNVKYENGGVINNDQIQGKAIDEFYTPKQSKAMGTNMSYPRRTLENPSYGNIRINPPQYHNPNVIREMRMEKRLSPSNIPTNSSFNKIDNNDIGFLFNESFGI